MPTPKKKPVPKKKRTPHFIQLDSLAAQSKQIKLLSANKRKYYMRQLTYDFLKLEQMGQSKMEMLGWGKDGSAYLKRGHLIESGADHAKEIVIKVPHESNELVVAEIELKKALQDKNKTNIKKAKKSIRLTRNKVKRTLTRWKKIYNTFKKAGINVLENYNVVLEGVLPRAEMDYEKLLEVHKQGVLVHAKRAKLSKGQASRRILAQVATEMAKIHRLGYYFLYPDNWALRVKKKPKQLEAIIVDFGSIYELPKGNKKQERIIKNFLTFFENLAGREEKMFFFDKYNEETMKDKTGMKVLQEINNIVLTNLTHTHSAEKPRGLL